MQVRMQRAATLALLLIVLAPPAEAAKVPIPVFWGTSERIIKAVELPQTEQFQMKDGTHVDIGHKYKVFEIFSVPLWDYEHVWVGYVGQDDQYLGMPSEQLQGVANLAGTSLPQSFTTPFWDAWGGKLLVGGLLAAALAWPMLRRRSA